MCDDNNVGIRCHEHSRLYCVQIEQKLSKSCVNLIGELPLQKLQKWASVYILKNMDAR